MASGSELATSDGSLVGIPAGSGPNGRRGASRPGVRLAWVGPRAGWVGRAEAGTAPAKAAVTAAATSRNRIGMQRKFNRPSSVARHHDGWRRRRSEREERGFLTLSQSWEV